jgi:hypothetical protein
MAFIIRKSFVCYECVTPLMGVRFLRGGGGGGLASLQENGSFRLLK